MGAPVAASSVRVLVVDDSRSFREAAWELIDCMRGFTCVGEASDGERGVEQNVRLHPDLVLLDMRMPGIGGVEAARRMLAHAPRPLVLLITSSDVPDRVPDGIVTLAKEQLNAASLQRIWERSLRW